MQRAVYRSPISEHFRGSFPLFVNRYLEGFELREHDHEYVELVYVMAGEGFHYIGGHVERVSKGELYILPVGTSHILRPGDAAGTNGPLVYNLCIRPDFVEELEGWLARYGSDGSLWSVFGVRPGEFRKVEDRDMRLGRAFEQLHREFEACEPGYEAAMFSLLLDLIVRLSRLIRQGDAAGSDRPRYAEIARLIDRIHEHLAEPLTLERMAEEAGMSPRHLIRLFRRHTGLTFSGYVQHKRIELACRLLLETDHKIEAIAKRTGYRDVKHFRRVFRRLTGMNPGLYRQQRAR